MSLYQIYYCIDSLKKYRSYEESLCVSELREAFDLIEVLIKDDTLYIYLIDSKDNLSITGEDDGNYLFEIDSSIGGIFSNVVHKKKLLLLLSNIDGLVADPEIHGFIAESV